MNEPIFVTTPTGNIGSKIVRNLVTAGENVHVLVRDASRIPEDIRSKITVHVGDLTDEAFVTKVTAGAVALFWLTPPNFTADDVQAVYAKSGDVARAAITANAIPYVVHLSSAGAHRDHAGPISLLRLIESAINETDADVVHLRAGFFFENFSEQVGPIQQANAIYMPVPAESSMPMVATADIAKMATDLLKNRSFGGKTYRGVHGPTDLSFAQAVIEIGAAIGRDIQYIQTSLEQAREMFLQLGATPAFADLYVEMFDSFANGPMNAEPRTAETTTPTTLREWAVEHIKPAVNL